MLLVAIVLYASVGLAVCSPEGQTSYSGDRASMAKSAPVRSSPQQTASDEISLLLVRTGEPVLLLIFGLTVLAMATGIKLTLSRKLTAKTQDIELLVAVPDRLRAQQSIAKES